MKRKASVVIVERLPLFSEALARLLEELGVDVVGRVKTLVVGLEYLKTRTPNMFVVDRDAAVKNVDVTEMVHAVSASSPNTRIVLLFGEFNGLDVRRARHAGVCGCLRKTDKAATLRRAFKSVLTRPVVPSMTTRERTAVLRPRYGVKSNGKILFAELTERELQVLPYIARGFSIKETAKILCTQPKTIDVHKTRLMAKLGIHDRVTMTRLAIRESLIPMWED